MPQATISETTICNMALRLIGASTITSLTQEFKNARVCNELYAQIRNDVLTDHAWTFAQKRVALVEAADPDPVWTDDRVTIAYNLPTDFLQLNFVNQKGALVKLEGTQLLSDTSELKIKYTFELTTVTQFRPKFIKALVARLAAEFAFPIANKSTLAERLFALYYEKELPQAISKDSQMGTPIRPAQDEWINARRMGSSGELVGQSGWDTWYPPCWV